MKGSKSALTLGLALACAAITFSLAVDAQAQNFSYFTNFSARDEGSSVMQATDGNLYMGGGPGAYNKGAILRVTPSGGFNVLYSFCSQRGCPDGTYPSTPILGSDGNFYGTTDSGGNRFDGGTVYKMTLAGNLTTLYSFCTTNQCPDGAEPGGIIQASDGNLYGITIGAAIEDSGTLFRVSTTGEFKELHYFCSAANCADGYEQSTPIQGIDGNLYGTTLLGGTHNGGVLYKLTLAGEYSVLYDFCSLSDCLDGGGPTGIVQDAEGNFFGTTSAGGKQYRSGDGYGTVFEFTSKNQYIVLDTFDYVHGDPVGGLTPASDGNLYGATRGEGDDGNGGTVFEVTPTGEITFLNIFGDSCALDTGFYAIGSIFQSTKGTLYGATAYGNSVGDCNPNGIGYGTIYSVSGLTPLVETAPLAGPVGQSVIILGNGLTGTTSVTFSSVEAEFTVESDTYIKATVPTGAKTGVVSVVTPSGTLKSNPQFVVSK
ncbi:MAG: choice-of-anchor tandem repeat GloVer-containing protein [Candidatus Sulfotelmatobacter sp.]